MVRPWVLVRGGRVAHCGSSPPATAPEGLPRISGGWLVEPLADAHVHLFLAGSFDTAVQNRLVPLGREDALARVLGLLESYRRAGIAAVRDGGDPLGVALEAARVANARPDHYAAVLPAGEPVFRRGRYGGFLGRGVETVGDVGRLLRENRAAGATHAKVVATGLNSLEEAGKVGGPQFSAAEFAAILEHAGDVGLPAMVHANGSVAKWGCVPRLGSTLEHGFWLEEADLRALKDSGAGWVPTLTAWESLAGRPGLAEHEFRVVRATAAKHRLEVRKGADLGIPILAGSDAGSPGVPHGGGLLQEIAALSEALTEKASGLAASTFAARRACEAELGRGLGGLDEGGPAGFVWLAEDPVENPRTLRVPRGVFLGGTWSSDRPQVES